MKIEITIELDADQHQVSIQSDGGLDTLQKTKLDCLADHLRAFCEWFGEEARTLQ
jgi:hypothetical protein